MDLEIITLSEVTEKEKIPLILLICGIQNMALLLLLSRFSRVRLCATP